MMTSWINVPWLALPFARVIGIYVAGLRPDAVISGSSISFFMTLMAVTHWRGVTALL